MCFRLPSEGKFAEHEQTGWDGGFDVVLGNPPWDQVEFKETEWFASIRPEIANAKPAAKRKQLIRTLQDTEPQLYALYWEQRQQPLRLSQYLAMSGRFPLCGRGRINSYSVFAELNMRLMGTRGRVGVITPAGIATDETTSYFFRHIVTQHVMSAFYGFENEARLFPGVNNMTKFCILILASGENKEAFEFIFFARHPDEIHNDARRFSLTADDIRYLNPNTQTCPTFRSARDASIARYTYRTFPVLMNRSSGKQSGWSVELRQGLFSMSGDSSLFRTADELRQEGYEQCGSDFLRRDCRYVPLYEAKMAHILDHRFGTYRGQTQAQANKGVLPQLTESDHAVATLLAVPMYWVKLDEVQRAIPKTWNRNWYLGWRAIAPSSNERTFIPFFGPRAGYGNSAILAFPENANVKAITCLGANLSTYCFDYHARQKIGGTNVSHFITEQLPVIPADVYDHPCPWDSRSELGKWINTRMLELTFTAVDMDSLAHDCGYCGPAFRWQDERRTSIGGEVDAAFFHLYGFPLK